MVSASESPLREGRAPRDGTGESGAARAEPRRRFRPFTRETTYSLRRHISALLELSNMREPVELPDSVACHGCGEDVALAAERCGCGADLDPLERTSCAALEHLEPGVKTELPKDAVGDPCDSGYRGSVLGRRLGQRADYRMRASALHDGDGRELHLREFDDRYTLHVDRHPARSPRHAVDDAPEVGLAAAAATVAALGLTAAVGALFGGEDG